jgi:iron complex transport system permease protein
MTRWSPGALITCLVFSTASAAFVAVACLCIGSTGINLPHGEILSYRLQTIGSAALVGAALAAAGVAYQAVLRNPLADPYLLGVSSGASLAAYVWQLPIFAAAAASLGPRASALSQQSFAFLGALAAVAVVFGIAGRRGRLEPVTLLLVGVIVNAVNGSFYLLLNAMTHQQPGNGGPLTFLAGGLQTTISNTQRLIALMLVAVGWIVLLYFTGQLNAAGLDDGEAESLGVRIHRLRWTVLLTASLITAAGVAISGPIGFVGLVCPHAARRFTGPDQRRLLPVATALGAVLLMCADAVSRYLSQPALLATVLPVGVLTGLLGGPFFLWLLFRARRTNRAN